MGLKEDQSFKVAVPLAILGCVLVCLGSRVIYVNPGDGFSGALGIFLWAPGGVLGLASFHFGSKRRWLFLFVLLLAGVAIVSVVMGLKRAIDSDPRMHAELRPATRP